MMSKLLLVVVFVGVLSAVTAANVPRSAAAPRATIEDVRFLLWTRSNSGDDEYTVVSEGDTGSLTHFNPEDQTVVLIHGFTSKGYDGWPLEGKTELLKQGSFNVISVDWSLLAQGPWYPTAVKNVPLVGALTARLLDWLHEEAAMDPAGVQVVGHSLGAHVSGAVGQNLKTFKLPFITGMDPAGPEFYNNPDSERLDKTDAEFVQVIHTNGGAVVDMCVGLKAELGHVDFFPNGGDHQPGCTALGDWMDLLTGGCSHGRSVQFWVESINGDPTFVSRPCSDWNTYQAGKCSSCGQGCLEMGFHVDRSLSGNYYLTTYSNKPFAIGNLADSKLH